MCTPAVASKHLSFSVAFIIWTFLTPPFPCYVVNPTLVASVFNMYKLPFSFIPLKYTLWQSLDDGYMVLGIILWWALYMQMPCHF